MIAENNFDNFKLAMSGLEKGLHVIHITTPTAQLLCCQADEDIETALERPELEPFDQIPVKEQDTIIGLLNKRECLDKAKGPARAYMQPLGEKILVSSGTPLLEFIKNDPLDRIVIDGTKIHGLVTRSDLLKLPVFLLGFALVTHIEALMLNMIRDTGASEEEWLPSEIKGNIQDRFKRLRNKRSDLDKLELTYFSEKCTILEKLSDLPEYASHLPVKNIINQLTEIKVLRNTIAHTSNISDDDDILANFIEGLRASEKWIEHWQNSTC